MNGTLRGSELDERLQMLARMAPSAGIFTDFDGSLSEIVLEHERAQAVPGASEALNALAEVFSLVAVVSGRDVHALSTRLHAPKVRLFGLYGVEERIDDGTTRAMPEAEAQRGAIDRAAALIEPVARAVTGVSIEHKGLSVAVHFRAAPDPEGAQHAVEPQVNEIAALQQLDVLVGRRVLELRPRVPVDKGRTVRALIEEHGLRAALVAGDDLGDIAMFDAAEAAPFAVRIAVVSAESPPELLSKADLLVRGPGELVALLRSLAASVDP